MMFGTLDEAGGELQAIFLVLNAVVCFSSALSAIAAPSGWIQRASNGGTQPRGVCPQEEAVRRRRRRGNSTGTRRTDGQQRGGSALAAVVSADVFRVWGLIGLVSPCF